MNEASKLASKFFRDLADIFEGRAIAGGKCQTKFAFPTKILQRPPPLHGYQEYPFVSIDSDRFVDSKSKKSIPSSQQAK